MFTSIYYVKSFINIKAILKSKQNSKKKFFYHKKTFCKIASKIHSKKFGLNKRKFRKYK